MHTRRENYANASGKGPLEVCHEEVTKVTFSSFPLAGLLEGLPGRKSRQRERERERERKKGERTDMLRGACVVKIVS